MICDLLDTYRKNSEGDRMVLDSYTLPSGLYIRLHTDDRGADELLVDKNTPHSGELYNWFKTVDFYSRLIEMNKPVDPKKKIHSNNIYSIFFKRDTLLLEGKLSPTFRESIIRYYDAFLNVNKDHKELLDSFELRDVDKEILQKNKERILSLTEWLAERVLSYNLKSNIYIKVFFNVNIEKYKEESTRYLIPRIFNNNNYNITFNGSIYGLSNTNMGLNAKKPYLEHKTTNYKVPFIVSIDDALDSKDMMEWLENQKNEEEDSILSGYLPVNEEEQFAFVDSIKDEMYAHYLYLEKGTKTIIGDYDFLPGVTDEIEPFKLYNYLRLDDFNADIINKRSRLEQIVDEWLYNGKLIKNYYNADSKSGLSNRQKNLLMLSKTAMLNFFKKCDDTSLRGCIDRVSLELIKEAILTSTSVIIEKTNIAFAMNLRLSMLKYFKVGGKENMGDMIMPLWEVLKKKIIDNKSDENQVCDSDIEFYFAAGQLTRYLISLSQAQKMNYSIIDPILNAKDSNKVKMEIYNLIKNIAMQLMKNRCE